MGALDELTAAVRELQAVFNESALINGVTVPIIRGGSTELGEAIEHGGVIYTQILSLYFTVQNNPAPQLEQTVIFAGLTYRIWRIQENVATWQIDLLQKTQA